MLLKKKEKEKKGESNVVKERKKEKIEIMKEMGNVD